RSIQTRARNDPVHHLPQSCPPHAAPRARASLTVYAPVFDNALLRELPGDPEQGPRRRQVEQAVWSRVQPTPVAAPRLLAHSAGVAAEVGMGQAWLYSRGFAQVCGGKAVVPGWDAVAGNYGGHQFGRWAGRLGDGRAVRLGEAVVADGARQELQLKGA